MDNTGRYGGLQFEAIIHVPMQKNGSRINCFAEGSKPVDERLTQEDVLPHSVIGHSDN